MALECVCAACAVPCKVPQLGGRLPVNHGVEEEKSGLFSSGMQHHLHAYLHDA